VINAGTGELPEGTVRPVTEAFVAAARLPQTDPDQAARIGLAEGQATLALLRTLGDGDWTRPTDCTEWDVVAGSRTDPEGNEFCVVAPSGG
jgi:hypothetical protein